MAARELILGSPEQIEARFPKLDDSQIAGLAGFGQAQDVRPDEVILDQCCEVGQYTVIAERILHSQEVLLREI